MYLASAWSFAKLSLDCPEVGAEWIKMFTFLGFEVYLPLQAKPASSSWCLRYHCSHGAGMQREVEPCHRSAHGKTTCSEYSTMTVLLLLTTQPQKRTAHQGLECGVEAVFFAFHWCSTLCFYSGDWEWANPWQCYSLNRWQDDRYLLLEVLILPLE